MPIVKVLTEERSDELRQRAGESKTTVVAEFEMCRSAGPVYLKEGISS